MAQGLRRTALGKLPPMKATPHALKREFERPLDSLADNPLAQPLHEPELRAGPFDFDGAGARFGGVLLALAPDCLALLRATAAATAAGPAAAVAPVPTGQLLAAIGQRGVWRVQPSAVDSDAEGTRALWSCVSRLNAVLAACSVDAGYVAHFHREGFALLLPRAEAGQPPGLQGLQGLPVRLSTIIACDDIGARIRARLLQHRLVSIVGAGGMGKTTIACRVAAGLAGQFADGICFVDLAPLADPRLLANVLAQALGIAAAPGAALASLAAFLREKQLLIVMDSCEHLVAAAADLAEQLLRAAPRLSLLVTSREPLLATGEWLYRLGAMRLPPKTGTLNAARALAFPAVQLLVERARERQPGFVLDDAGAALAGALCHRLDGIPLAIELAAARLEHLGLAHLSEQLGQYLLNAVSGRRSAAARHRTLGAMIDWSFDLLPPREQQALLKLSVFRGEFTLAAADSLLSEATLDGAAIGDGADCVLELLSKSLVSQRAEGSLHRYRLFDTTRAYAAAKLDAVSRRGLLERHARFLCALLAQAEDDWLVMGRLDWLSTYKIWIDDIRVALGWTFGRADDQADAPAQPDLALGNALVIASFPLGHQASLTAEFGEYVGHAMSLAPRSSDTATLLYSQLYALICNVNAAIDPEHSGLAAAARTADMAAEGNPLARYRTSLATSMWAADFIPGNFPAAGVRADITRLHADNRGDRMGALVARRMQAQSLHFLGRQAEARSHAEHVLANAWRRIPLVCSPSQVDVRVSMRAIIARIAWIGGRPAEALEVASEALRHAGADTAVALAQALAISSIPLALWSGDIARARQLVQRLSSHAGAYSLHMWMAWAAFYVDVMRATAESPDAGASAARLCVPAARQLELMPRDHMVTFSTALLATDCIERVAHGTVGWCAAEMQRALGERHLREGRIVEATSRFEQALATARSQGALAWELRAATSLAGLWARQARGGPARALLEPLLGLFTDGAPSADLQRARLLLDQL